MNNMERERVMLTLQELGKHSEGVLKQYPGMLKRQWYHNLFGMTTRGEIHQEIIRLSAAGISGIETGNIEPAKQALDFLIRLYEADYDAHKESLFGQRQTSQIRGSVLDFKKIRDDLLN